MGVETVRIHHTLHTYANTHSSSFSLHFFCDQTKKLGDYSSTIQEGGGAANPTSGKCCGLAKYQSLEGTRTIEQPFTLASMLAPASTSFSDSAFLSVAAMEEEYPRKWRREEPLLLVHLTSAPFSNNSSTILGGVLGVQKQPKQGKHGPRKDVRTQERKVGGGGGVKKEEIENDAR